MKADGPVVIALDGGPHSPRTLEWGMAEARRRGATAVLARAYQEPREYTQWTWYPILEGMAFDAEAKDYLAEQLEAAANRWPDVPVETRLLHGPEVALLRDVSDLAQLLVVGARGRAGRRQVGRVSGHLAAHGQCPVVLVGDRSPDDDAEAPVVVGVDGSPGSLVAARVAAREASLRDVALVVVHARAVHGGPGDDVPVTPTLAAGVEADPAHRGAQEVASSLRDDLPGLEVGVRLVDDDPVHALVEAGRGAALLIVGSRGLGAFRGMLLGSVSNDVVRHAPTHVMVVHGIEPG